MIPVALLLFPSAKLAHETPHGLLVTRITVIGDQVALPLDAAGFPEKEMPKSGSLVWPVLPALAFPKYPALAQPPRLPSGKHLRFHVGRR
jgi:hypothetical protein